MNLKGVLEGILFVQGDDGATVHELLEILGIEKEELKKLILELKTLKLAKRKKVKARRRRNGRN